MVVDGGLSQCGVVLVFVGITPLLSSWGRYAAWLAIRSALRSSLPPIGFGVRHHFAALMGAGSCRLQASSLKLQAASLKLPTYQDSHFLSAILPIALILFFYFLDDQDLQDVRISRIRLEVNLKFLSTTVRQGLLGWLHSELSSCIYRGTWCFVDND